MFFSVTTNTPSLSLAGTDHLNGSRSQAVAVADLNGDGKLDLAVGNLDSATVSIFLGIGDGTFTPRVDFATGQFPNSVAIGDFNGDGKPDLALANGSGTISILSGNGDGTFQPHVDYPVGIGPYSADVEYRHQRRFCSDERLRDKRGGGRDLHHLGHLYAHRRRGAISHGHDHR